MSKSGVPWYFSFCLRNFFNILWYIHKVPRYLPVVPWYIFFLPMNFLKVPWYFHKVPWYFSFCSWYFFVIPGRIYGNQNKTAPKKSIPTAFRRISIGFRSIPTGIRWIRIGFLLIPIGIGCFPVGIRRKATETGLFLGKLTKNQGIRNYVI